jgi:4-hydroxybenzoate polyprenyltransferase
MEISRGLALACHPGPAAVVTVVITLLSIVAGRAALGVALTFLAALVGQLSVGWSNDARDAQRDLAARRTEKPTVSGLISARLLWRCAFIALASCVLLSYLAAGRIGGTAHVIAVASAWVYNLALKTSIWSWVPYALSFGLVPAFVTYGLTPPQAPTLWVSAASMVLGVGAHLANGLPDIDTDQEIGAGGLVVALGRRRAGALAIVLLVGAISLVIGHSGFVQALQLVLVIVVMGASAAVLISGSPRALFRLALVLAVLAVLLLVTSAQSISG